MKESQSRLQEKDISKVMRKAFKQFLKGIRSEPTTLVIESDNTQADASEETAADIRAWLFRKE